LTSNSGPSIRFGDPAAALGFRQVLELHAGGATVIAPCFLGEFPGEALQIGNFIGAKKPRGSSVDS